MWSARFDPEARCIWLKARLHGPVGDREHQFLLDTGTPQTIIDTGIADALCQDLPLHLGVHGLIGMDLLERRITTIDGIEGLLSVGP